MGVLHSSFLPEHQDTQGMTQIIFYYDNIRSFIKIRKQLSQNIPLNRDKSAKDCRILHQF